MGVEIERKFLVDQKLWEAVQPKVGKQLKQGYLSHDPSKTIRVRIADDQAFLTIKNKGNGLKRLEFEYEIPLAEGEELLQNFCQRFIHKMRFEIQFSGKLWEVDVFFTPMEGLILAEIELTDEQETFELPHWVTEEVTGNPTYYNANMLL